MSVNDFFNTIHFLLTVEPKNHQSLEILINSNSKEFNINQVSQFLNFIIRISLELLKNIFLDSRHNFAFEKNYCHQ
jgi:hypothetical protein